METHDNDYVAFPIIENLPESVVSHEEICEPSVDCMISDSLAVVVDDVNSAINDSRATDVEILTEHSEDEDDKSLYPIYVKQEEEQQQQQQQQQQQHQYTSGDDESMAVEALRQLGGMYPCFESKKIRCARCLADFTQSQLTKHSETCCADVKLCCPTCNELFERKQDLDNHMVCHQVDRPHSCRTCGNLFRSKSHLQNHIAQLHKNEKPHKCTICGLDFNRPSSLSNHMKIHNYIAGRALVQAENKVTTTTTTTTTTGGLLQNETINKWHEDPRDVTSTSAGYDVNWSVPYNFDSSVETISAVGEKIDNLQEYTVMPNGEVAQFEYTSQDDPLATSDTSAHYQIAGNTFDSSESLIKVENLTFQTSETASFPEILINESSEKVHACVQCGAIFSRPEALASHSKIHAPKIWTMPIECEYCDKQFQDSAHLSTHQNTCAKKLMRNSLENGATNGKWGKHACAECGKKFTTKQKMFRHQWIHRKKTHTCEICGVQFEKQNQLDEHRLSEHPGDSPFTCAECGKSFVSRQGLWEHGRTHAGSPAHFHCDTCSKTFSSRQGYLIHHRTHTGERPYGCKFCWKAFRDGGTLRKHERIHTGERPHVCPLCSRAFNQKVVLREHVRWVHAAGKNETEVSGPPYPCPLCGSLNQDRDELCAHIVKHSDQMIAEAKAKSNTVNGNTSKTKITRKRTRSGETSGSKTTKTIVDGTMISRSEETEALLSIAAKRSEEQRRVSDNVETAGEMLSNSEGGQELLIIGENSEIGDIITDNAKINEHDTVVVSGQTAIITKIRQSDVLHFIQSTKRHETLRLVASGKTNNTLHLITKQNQSLPVVAIRNPQSHENFSSQITEAVETRVDKGNKVIATDNSRRDECPMDGETDDVGIEQRAVEYLRERKSRASEDDDDEEEGEEEEEEDEDEEMVCGICGDDFDDKNILMEHVKIHI